MSRWPNWRTAAAASLVALVSPLAASAASGDAPAARLTTSAPLTVHLWRGTAADAAAASGQLTLGGRPVAGAVVSIAGYPVTTDTRGRFVVDLDRTVIRRYPVRVVDAARALVGGKRLSGAKRQALKRVQAAFTVAYRISGLSLQRQADGNVLVRGRLGFAGGPPPPKVVLYGYRLFGQVRDAHGGPVAGAVVGTESQDGDGWSFSGPSNAEGAYTAFYNPVGTEPVTLRVAVGDTTWQLPRPLHLRHFGSTRLDIRLPARGGALPRVHPVPTPGAMYEGVIVGAEVDGQPVRPLAASWPDATGRFRLVLPSSTAGHRLTFFEDQSYYLAPIGTRPGAAIPLRAWPRRLAGQVPQGLHAASQFTPNERRPS